MISSNLAPLIEGLATALELKQTNGGYLGTCPLCHYPRAFSISLKQDTALYFCHACHGSFNEFLAYFNTMGWTYQNQNQSRANAKVAKVANVLAAPSEKRALAFHLWSMAYPLEATLAEVYLRHRAIACVASPTLRFSPYLKHTPTDTTLPAMIAKVTTATGEFLGVHRTYLSPDGKRKADVCSPKMMLGNIKGGSVHLSPLAGDTLAVCEGIETGLSIQQATGIPTWAALSTGGMAQLQLPLGTTTLIVCMDHDEAGLKAGQALSQRALAQDITVKKITPPQQGSDFNDFIQEMF
ncbi:MAG: toprim domain-containing protein [Vampirovibrionales bacterium]